MQILNGGYSMIPVKICGITNIHDALICVQHGVTALGFVFAESKRQVDPAAVYEITRQLPPFITRVGVFVDEDPWVIRDILKDCGLDLAQLHGSEPLTVTDILPGRVIKTFKAGYEPPDHPEVTCWQDTPLRAVLIDTYSPGAAGGTGQPFDWELFKAYRSLKFPLILAGGLTPGNIKRAIQQAQPDAVDLSSGVEKEPGIKEPIKIEALMREMH
jgi:phosphoribosylanthranilate isomerase